MSLLHNAEADFAAAELARMFTADPSLCYEATMAPGSVSATASYEPSASPWPKADGLVSLLEGGSQVQRDVAIEYKRIQEGVHGLLTAIGQSQGYLHKGYNGAAIVVPSRYSSLEEPGRYIAEVLERASGVRPVGVFTYQEPDSTSASPFSNRLQCVRPVRLGGEPSHLGANASRPRTQWVHMREGSTTRDGFFRFLQAAKKLSADENAADPDIPAGLRDAIARIAPGRSAVHYLSNTADDRFLSKVWRSFWFEWVVTPDVLKVWERDVDGTYRCPNASTKILKDDGSGRSQIFEGRADSLKALIVQHLNARTIDEGAAWEFFAAGIQRDGMQNKQGVRERAHSYREDLDSALAQLGWIESDGRPSDRGYKFMTLCERYGGPNSRAAVDYLGATLLQAGHYGAFLHYIHRLSEQKFTANPLEFTEMSGTGRPVFNEASYTAYLAYLEEEMSERLKVMRKVSGRARPRRRTVFQAELTLLRNYGFVSQARFRLGVGIPIDWERVHEAMKVEL